MSRLERVLHSPAAADCRRLATALRRPVSLLVMLAVAAISVAVVALAGGGPHARAAIPSGTSATGERLTPRPAAAGALAGVVISSAAPVPSVSESDAPAKRSSVPAPCAANTHPRLLVVSVSQQHAWACSGDREVFSTPVTTGNVAAGWATPTGTWRIEDRQTNRYLVGPGYRDHVRYWMPFFGNYGFHDASWQRLPFGSAL